MRRREFITGLGAATAWPKIGRAQQSLPLIAILGSGAADAPSSLTAMRGITGGLTALGLVEGRA
jgi:hypothetical protein